MKKFFLVLTEVFCDCREAVAKSAAITSGGLLWVIVVAFVTADNQNEIAKAAWYALPGFAAVFGGGFVLFILFIAIMKMAIKRYFS